ncbi:MAG TPA: hypothetical protein PKI02_09180 [Mycobacterium sp.]|nr:hypothetical protein [Mycobacterium sp.]
MASVSLWVTPTRASRPWCSGRIAPTTAPSTDTDADVTRCTSTRMGADASPCP